MSVSERLGRLLFIVPYVAHRDGVPVRELAEVLGIKPQKLQADLELLSMVGQPPLTPDHLIDLYVEDDVVYVELDQNLSRPLRLTHDEARALALAARMVGDLGGLGDDLDRVVEQILELLNPVDAAMVRSMRGRIELCAAQEDERAGHLREAVEEHREIEIDYYSASSDRQKRYHLKPLALLNHTGVEYLLALDVNAQDREKLFRTDRMATVTVCPTHFTPDGDVDLEKYRRPTIYTGPPGQTAEVRFSPRVARIVMERFSEHRLHEDGSVSVTLRTSSAPWLARWVLPFGVDAEVVGPPEQRQVLRDLCRQAAAAYEEDPPAPPKG